MKHIINDEEVNIHWEQMDLIERHDSGCAEYAVRGDGDNGIEYQGTGSYQDDELFDVTDIEILE